MWGKVNTSLPGLISAKDLCKSTCTTSGNAQPQKFKRTRSSAPDRSSLLRDPKFVNELQYATFNSKSEMVICSKGFTRFSREVNAVWDKRKWRIRSDCMSSDNTWISDKCWQPVTSSFKVCRDVILGRQLPEDGEDGEDGEVMLLPPKCFSSHPEKSRSKTSKGRNIPSEMRFREFPGKTFTLKNLQYPEIMVIIMNSWCISCQLPKSSLSLSPRQSKSSRFWAYHGFTCPKDLLYFATILKPPQTFGDFTLPPVRRSNSVGYGKENQLFVKDNGRPGAKSVTRPVK